MVLSVFAWGSSETTGLSLLTFTTAPHVVMSKAAQVTLILHVIWHDSSSQLR